MGISNQSSGSRPGVCTSTTRPTAPYNGMVIYETDSKQTLVYNGTAWVMLTDADTPPGLELITSASFSAVTELLVDNVFSSTYRNYRIAWDAQSSAGGSTVVLQYRTSTTTTSNYQYTAILTGGGNPTGSTQTAQGGIRVGANDTNGWNSLEMTIFCPNIAQSTRSITSFVRNNGLNCEQTWGAQTDSTQFTGFRLSIGSGNMTGSYFVYGYRNSI